MTVELYLLMDARAAHDVDDAVVLDTGAATDMCKAANEGEFGDGCMVVNERMEVMWAWFTTGKWKAPKS